MEGLIPKKDLSSLISDLVIHLKCISESPFCSEIPIQSSASICLTERALYPASLEAGLDCVNFDMKSNLAELKEEDKWNNLREEVCACSKCRLHQNRNKVVFGAGLSSSPLVAFVGEGPGADEDEQGEPFVGRSGKLLTKAIENGMGLSREQVYICNVVKCRPPENRAPLSDEIQACSPYLFEQLKFIKPRIIVSLGSVAFKTLLGNADGGITTNRGSFKDWEGIPLVATYHPAYLLRNPSAKAQFWGDLKLVMSFLGLSIPNSSGPKSNGSE